MIVSTRCLEVLEAIEQHGTLRAAAASLGISNERVRQHYLKAERIARLDSFLGSLNGGRPEPRFGNKMSPRNIHVILQIIREEMK